MKRFYSLLIAFIVAISASMAAHTQLYLVGGFSGWGFSPENELSTTDGDYYVATYPTGSEIELSGEFKIADPTWKILDYGGASSVEAGKSYTLVAGAGNNSAVGKIKITKIEFTVSTATLKISGATSANLFDLSKDQGVSLVESSTNGEKFVSKLTFKGNGVYTGTYTVPNYEFYLKIGGDGNFNTIDYGWNGNYIVLGESYILKKGEMLFAEVYPDEGDWKAGDVFDVKVTFTADWTATLLLTKSTVTPTPEPDPAVPTFVVAGNGGSDATGIWCNGIEWVGDATANAMTDANKDGIFEITYKNVPAGTWSFKVVVNTEPVQWLGGEFLDAKNSSTGYTIQDGGNIAFSLSNAADVTIKVDSANGKITLTTPSGSFGKAQIEHFTIANGDECLAENRFTATNNNTLKYTENIQISEGNEYGYAVYRILGNCNYAVYEKNLLVEVTEAGIYDITIVFNGDYENPDFTITAVKQTPVEPDPEPVVTITNLQIGKFSNTEVGNTSTATATYTLSGATSATASLSGAGAAYFKILSQNVSNGNGTVQIEFTPTQARKYNATLTIAAGSASESVAFSAIGQEPVIIISNLQTPKFTVTEEDKTSVATVTYDLEGATSATATLSGADAIYFKIVSQSVSGGRGTVEIEFAPNIARKYNATLTITAGKESESVSFNAIAADAPVAPAIKNLKIEEFDIVRANESSTSLITYQLENADLTDISISGTDVDYFTLKSSGSDYSIVFTPVAAGVYVATLTITATNGLSASLDFAAACESATHSPVLDPVVTISNLKVPAFEDTQVGKTSFITATFKVQGTTCATASLSGTNATSFKIMSQSVTDGKGEVKIKFVPSKEGVYNATLTVSAGNENVITTITAKTTTAQPDPEPGPGDDPSDDPDPEPGPGDDPSDDPDPEPGPGDDPTPDPEPDPYPEYPILGYIYIVETEDTKYKDIVKYQPIGEVDEYTLAPEKIDQEIYGLEIYKYEIRDEIYIRYWKEDDTMDRDFRDHNKEGVDITKTPYYANGVWYESIEEMMTWYVRYLPYWDDEASKVMIEESPGVYVATFDAVAKSSDNDKYYYCLGNVEDPILEVGVGKNSSIQNYLRIPKGFKAMIYLDDTNWETEWKTYYKLVPPGDGWDKPYVDLGLPSGLCWAVKNLGADKPEDEGHHFAWGEVEPKEDYSYKTYKWANLLKNNEYIKYVTNDRYGFVDFRTTLDPSDDAANVALGSKWHIPSKLATQELLKECTTEFGYYYGVKGYFITGPNGNAIFLPGAVERKGTEHGERGNGGSYWTSTLYEEAQSRAHKLVFNLTYIFSKDNDYQSRTDGLVIRPVIHRDYVGVDEVEADAIEVYAKDGTIYSELDFEIYNLTGINVTHLNGSLEGIYIVKTNEGNRLISVW